MKLNLDLLEKLAQDHESLMVQSETLDRLVDLARACVAWDHEDHNWDLRMKQSLALAGL